LQTPVDRSHKPTQQSSSDTHGSPLATHPHVPLLLHWPEQQSEAKLQALPSMLQ
jgi:hypothetical protein